jgi:Predicted outer membrane protein
MSSRLDRIKIAAPCPIAWEQMVGDERVRFCHHCQLNVYNLSSLNKADAEALLASTEGRLCARLYRRSDGTVLTSDCPVGVRAVRKKLARTAAAVFALVGSLTTVALGQSKSTKQDSCTTQVSITQREINSSSQTSIITGQVTDPNDALVPGATVTLQNTSTKQVQTTTTTDEGAFEFSELAPGKYSIKVKLQGFGKHKPVEIRINNNQAITVKLSLVLPAGEVLVGVVAYDETDPPGTTTISQKLLRSLPH